MTITVACVSCGSPYDVDEKFIGQRVKCKKCGSVFKIERPEPLPLPDEDPFARASFEPTVQPAAETDRKAKWKVGTVIAGELAPSPALEAATPLRPLRRRYRGRQGKSSPGDGLDTATPYLLLVYVAASILFGIYGTVALFSHSASIPKVTPAVVSVWETALCADALLFAILGPMMWLGVWCVSKMSNFPMVDLPYVRACGVVAIPTILLFLGLTLQGPLQILVFLAILPVVFFLIKWLFDLDWESGALGFVLGAGCWVLGFFLQNFILGLLIPGSVLSVIVPKHTDNSDVASVSPADPGNSSPGGTSVTTSDRSEFSRFREQVLNQTNVDISQSTKEEVLPQADDLQRRLKLMTPKYGNDPEWGDLTRMVESFHAKAAALPSGELDKTLFDEASDGDDWTTGSLSRGKLAGEVSFKQFKFQPPMDMTVDVHSSEDSPIGLVWTGTPSPGGRLAVYSRPRTNQKQRRPVLTNQPGLARVANAAGDLVIPGSPGTATYGVISGLPFTCIDANPDSKEEHAKLYIGARRRHLDLF